MRTVFQSYALFPHMTVEGNIAFPLQMAKTPAAAIPGKVAGGARGRAAGRLRQALSARALRRPEAARRHRPRAGHASDGAAAGRAAGRARREAARGDADRADQPAEGGRHHVRLRDARSDRGAGAVAPDRGDEQGPRRADSTSRRASTAFRNRASSPISSAPATCSRADRVERGRHRRDRGRRTRPRARRGGHGLPAPAVAGTIALRPEKIRVQPPRRRAPAQPATGQSLSSAPSPNISTWAT